MLDDLRNSATFEEEPQPPEEGEVGRPLPRRQVKQPFLGMTSAQRFVIALLLFLMVCVLASFCLLLTESIYLPFL
jgi:hypothetical protein